MSLNKKKQLEFRRALLACSMAITRNVENSIITFLKLSPWGTNKAANLSQYQP